MDEVLRWWLVAYGITLIVTEGEIFAKFRALPPEGSFFAKLLSCPMCFGFWVGAALAIVGLPLVYGGTTIGGRALSAVLSGAGASAACWLAHAVVLWLWAAASGPGQH